MLKNSFKIAILLMVLVTFLQASKNENIQSQINDINYELNNLELSNKYEKELNKEKITLIMGQIIEKENEIKKLEKELKEYINKEALEKEINAQNNLIDNINSDVDRLSIIVSISIGLFGVLITGIVIFFALRYESIARAQADKEVKAWIDDKADKEFQPKADSYLFEIEEKANELLKKIEEKADELNNKHEEKIIEIDLLKQSLLQNDDYNDINNLTKRIEEIKNKNENNYTFDDWYDLFTKEYLEERYENALEYIESAFEKASSDIENINVLLGKAFSLFNLKQNKKSLVYLNSIINSFADKQNSEIIETKLSLAIINKAFLLETIDKNESIEVYNYYINKYEQSKNIQILRNLSTAYLNKGVLLFKDDKKSEALIEYDYIIKRFETTKDDFINVSLIKAMNNKGVIYNKLGKYNDSVIVFNNVEKKINADISNIELLKQLSIALLQKCFAMLKLEDFENLAKLNEELLKKLENKSKENNALILQNVLMVYLYKADALHKKGQGDRANIIFNFIIEEYKENKDEDILEIVSTALLNKMECVLVKYYNINNVDKEIFEKYNKSELKMYDFEMLKILEASLSQKQNVQLNEWIKKVENKKLNSWTFDELDKWSNFLEGESKNRVQEYLKIFKKYY